MASTFGSAVILQTKSNEDDEEDEAWSSNKKTVT